MIAAAVAGAAADALGYGGAIALVAGLTAASGMWVLIDMPGWQGEFRGPGLNPIERWSSPDAPAGRQRCNRAMNLLVIVNDQPYGSERPYNALRLAGALSKRDDVEVRVFLFGDAVACAVAGQQLPDGHYHLDRMLVPLVRRGEVACCGTCMDARGIEQASLVDGARRSTLEKLADWVEWADQALTF